MKENLWEYLRREGSEEQITEIFGEIQILQLLEQFFDRAMYFSVVGYERAGGRQSRRPRRKRWEVNRMAWETEYSRKLATAAEALQVVESGMRVFVHASSGFPAALVDALADRAPSLRDVEIVHLLTFSEIRTAEPQYAGKFPP